MAFVNPGELFVQRHGLISSGADVLRYVDFLRTEARLAIDPPIDLSRIYTRFRMPTPQLAPLEKQQGLLLSPEQGLVLIKEDDPRRRQRFTEAHELMEYLFNAQSRGKGWAARRVGPFKESVKEGLCDAGAAELLMPRAGFAARVANEGVSFRTGSLLCEEYDVSLTAALIQMVHVGPGLHAVVRWKLKNKPVEVRSEIADSQLPLFGSATDSLRPPKLRIEWSFSSDQAPFIPRDKSVPEQSSIYAAWRDGTFTSGNEFLNLGSISGQFRCENQPLQMVEDRQVLSLLHLPGDHGCA